MSSRYHTVRLKKRLGKTRSSKSRPKSFKNEDSARAWASANGIAKYTLVNLKTADSSEKKIRVIAS